LSVVERQLPVQPCPLLNVIEDEELGVTLATAVGVMEKAPPGDSGGAFVVGLTC
jgi:hypothetical protein